MNRLTLSGGIRLDMQNESTSDFTSQPHRWMPTRNQSIRPSRTCRTGKTSTPASRSPTISSAPARRRSRRARAAASSRTRSATHARTTRPTRSVTQVSRTWNDTNNNFTPDCDLLQLLSRTASAWMWQDLGFGSSRVTTFYDPRMLEGWGVRGYNWEFSAGVQHEIIPRLSASVGYFRRIYGNFNVQDNEALAPLDFTRYSVVAADRRASGAVGTDDRRHLRPEPCRHEPQRHQACIRFRDVKSALERSGLLDRYAASERGVAAGWRQHWQDHERLLRHRRRSARGAFIDCRPDRGSAGRNWRTGGRVDARGFCHQETPFLTQYKAVAAYTLPYGIRIAGTFQSIPGPVIAANQIYTAHRRPRSAGRSSLASRP